MWLNRACNVLRSYPPLARSPGPQIVRFPPIPRSPGVPHERRAPHQSSLSSSRSQRSSPRARSRNLHLSRTHPLPAAPLLPSVDRDRPTAFNRRPRILRRTRQFVSRGDLRGCRRLRSRRRALPRPPRPRRPAAHRTHRLSGVHHRRGCPPAPDLTQYRASPSPCNYRPHQRDAARSRHAPPLRPHPRAAAPPSPLPGHAGTGRGPRTPARNPRSQRRPCRGCRGSWGRRGSTSRRGCPTVIAPPLRDRVGICAADRVPRTLLSANSQSPFLSP